MNTHYQLGLFVLLSLAALVVGATQRGRIDALFHGRIQVEGAQPLADIRGARAGEIVDLRAPLAAVDYTVEPGDSWSRIAKAFQVRDYNALAKHNGFRDLQPGMQIEIPAELRERQ